MEVFNAKTLETNFSEWFHQNLEGKKVIAAVSGGGDSVALLRLLKSIGADCEVGHFDHAIRAESADDALFVQNLSRELGFDFHSIRVDIPKIALEKKQNLEATARELRYSFLIRTAKEVGADAILTAHNSGDQAETVLVQLAQGTGRAFGMREKNGRIFRPLLGVSRLDLRAYLESLGQDWLEDSSNQNTELNRSYMRHEVLPKLSKRFLGAEESIGRFARIAQSDDDALTRRAEIVLQRDERWPCPAFRVQPLRMAGDAVRKRALRMILETIRVRPESRWIEALDVALQEKSQSLTGGWQARVREGTLFLIPKELNKQNDPPVKAKVVVPAGHKPLMDYLADRGIPQELKKAWPIRIENNEIVWVKDFSPENIDIQMMKIALEEARGAESRDEVPIGAALVITGEIISREGNRVMELGQSIAHAELLAIQKACEARGKVLPGSTLYVTLEPCPMCYGAILEAQIGRVVFAVENTKAGAVTVHGLKPAMKWEGGWLERESKKMLTRFFQGKR